MSYVLLLPLRFRLLYKTDLDWESYFLFFRKTFRDGCPKPNMTQQVLRLCTDGDWSSTVFSFLTPPPPSQIGSVCQIFRQVNLLQ